MTEMVRVEAGFRLRSSKLDPAKVTHTLGISPSFARAKGAEDPRTGRKQPTGVWLLSTRELALSATKDVLDCHLRSLLDQLEGKTEIVREFVRNRYKADFYASCYMQVENEGTTISPQTIERIAALGASLDLSVWVPSELMGE